MDETSVNKILEFTRLLYEQGKYDDAKRILTDYYKITKENKKNTDKLILALWILFSIEIILGKIEDIIYTFDIIKNSIEEVKENLEEQFKKINIESETVIRN